MWAIKIEKCKRQKMNLRYITCSDPREHNSVKSIIELAHLPLAEIAVQCHPSKMSSGMPRNVWFEQLLRVAKQTTHINLAMHINNEWAKDICVDGIIPEIILNWMQIEHRHNKPLVKRIQLNMPQTAADNIDAEKLAKIIHDFKHHEFIIQYNDKTKEAVEKLHNTGAKFSLLFDASGGNGVQPTQWQKPIYENHPMGYSGGLSPENVMQNLDNINHVVGDTPIWIDAEGKLKSQTLFEDKALFDVKLAQSYIRRARLWQKQH